MKYEMNYFLIDTEIDTGINYFSVASAKYI